MWVVLLAACSGDPAPPVVETPQAVHEPAVEEPAAEPQPQPQPQPQPMAAQGPPPAEPGALSNKWLIILHSSKVPGEVVPGISALADVELETAPMTLVSSRYKRLMPCYEVTIANAFDDRKASIAYSKALTAAGVSNYPKNAGAWVGADPRIDAFCGGGEELTEACPAGARMTETWGDRTYVHLGLDPATTERSLDGAAEPQPIAGADGAWRSPLSSVEQLGDWKRGSTVTVAGPDLPETCQVAGFVALTRGTPHFGWFEGPKSSPGCGTAALFAELDCAAPEGLLAVPEGAPVPIIGDDVQIPVMEGEEAIKAMGDGGALAEVMARATASAAKAGAPLETDTSVEAFTVDSARFYRVEQHLFTGEAFNSCGGEDVSLAVAGIVKEDFTVLQPWRVVSPKVPTVLVDVDRDGIPESFEEAWPGIRRIVTHTGDTACAVSVDYCDCAC